MPNEERLLGAVGQASLVAGPLFVALMLLLGYQEMAGQTLPLHAADLVEMLVPAILLLMVSAFVGACLAFPVCLVMGGTMLLLANRLPLARPTVLWIAVGGGSALASTYLMFDTIDEVGALAFAGTAMGCAVLVRSSFHWD